MVECQLPKLSARVRFPSLAPVRILNKNISIKIFVGILILFLSGCTTVQELPSGPAGTPVTPAKGVYHKVLKGQTIWRIAQAYGISIDDIIKINNIPNVAKVEENQLIFIPGADAVKTIAVDTPDLKNSEFIWPVKGKVVGFFGERQAGQLNKGIKIQAEPGSLVLATRTGRVVFADALAGYGDTVVIDHEDGFLSVYADNASLMVSLNNLVSQGTPIGRIGKSTGHPAYIHFEIRKHTVAENPLYYLP